MAKKTKPAPQPEPTTVAIQFANPAAADHFLSWLDGSGEQQYWDWMECREQDEDGDITAVDFKVPWGKGGKLTPKDGTIVVRTDCGRLGRDD